MGALQEFGKLDGVLWSALWAPHKNSAQSLQTQLRQMLVASMLDGVLPAQTFLPSTRELAQALGISRKTVTIVYQLLADEGYLRVTPRLGYWVADVLPSGDLQWAQGPGANSIREDLLASGAGIDWAARMCGQFAAQRSIEKPSNWRDYRYPFMAEE